MRLDSAIVALYLLVAVENAVGCVTQESEVLHQTDSLSTSRNPEAEDVADETDLAAVETVWKGLKESMEANDLQLVGQYFTEASRDRYVTLYGYLGSEMAEVPSTWSKFTAIELTDNIAVFAFIQTEPSGDRMYRVVFVRVPERGWLIQEM